MTDDAVSPTPSVTALRTVILSDLHLTDAEPVDPSRPYWKAFKRREFFFDDDFARLLAWLEGSAEEPVELILNGDIFEFDDMTELPDEPPGPIDWLERRRGLGSEEWMSRFKMGRIIADHPVWFSALADFVRRGNHAVFVIGNHDLELHWPSVQQMVTAALDLDDQAAARVRFCNWFYLSGGDTYVSHGNQYDPYCVIKTPIDPLIDVRGRPRVRIPFGDLAQRYMLNGMGYFNPHATGNYIMSAWAYVRFFARYMLRTQPLLVLTWFWSAMVTLWRSLRDHWRPPMRDPLTVEEKVADIAARSNATPATARRLLALDVPSACTNPLMIAQELWLARGLLFLLVVVGAFQFIATVNFVWPISPWWILLLLALLFPVFLLYSFKVRPQVFVEPLLTPRRAELIATITGARNVVFGHTHVPVIEAIGPVVYANSGFWSPAFTEPECIHRIGVPTFVELAGDDAGPRRPALFSWPAGAEAPVPCEAAPQLHTAKSPADAPAAPALSST